MSQLKRILNYPVSLYTLLFIIISFCTFYPYFLTDTSLIWQSDGLTQHYPALIQWQHDLKQLVFDHTWPAMWDWHLGLGADYLQTFSYYTIGDVFTYPIIFFSKSAVITYYGLSIILRLYFAGLSFIYSLKFFIQQYTPWSAGITAIGYTFFGYTAFAAFEHPFFLNPLIIFPLLIVSIYRALLNHNYVFFTIMVAWTLINNFYFAFIMMLGSLCFVIGLLIQNRSLFQGKNILTIIISMTIGLLLSSFLFFPAIYGLLTSARSNASLGNGLTIYPLSYYLALPGNLIGNFTIPNFWLTGGLMSVNILAICYTIRRFKRYLGLNLLWIACTLVLLLPACAGLLNGGSSPSNRWTFMVALPVGFATVYFLNHLTELTMTDFYIFFSVGLLISISLLISNKFNLNSRYGLIIALYWISMLIISAHLPFKYRRIGLITILLANAFLVMNRNHTNNTSATTSSMASIHAAKYLVRIQESYQTASNAFQRVYIDNILNNLNGISPASNLPILSRVNNIESYWSLQNRFVYNLMSDLQINNSNGNDSTSNLDNRNVLANILGVTYYFRNAANAAPASYQDNNLPTVNGQTIFKSTNSYPLFYVPKYVVSNHTFNQLSATQREATLADSVVIKKSSQQKTTKSAFAKTLSVAQIAYNRNNKFTSSLNISAKTHNSLLADGIILKNTDNLSGTELHLELTNITFTPFTFKQQLNYAISHDNYNYQQHQRNPQIPFDQRHNSKAFKWGWIKTHFNHLGEQTTGYKISATYNNHKTTFTQNSRNNLSFYVPHQSATLNLGINITSDNDKIFIPLYFSNNGTYNFTARIVGIPIDNRFERVSQIIQKNKPTYHMSKNKIIVHTNTPKKTIIASTIPFSAGWKTHNSKVKILKVNKGFIGLQVPAGKQTIRLYYQTPYLRLGAYLSLIGLFISSVWIGIIFFRKK